MSSLLASACGGGGAADGGGGDAGSSSDTGAAADTGPVADTGSVPDTGATDGGSSTCGYFPPTAPGDETWETESPADAGWDEAALQDMADYAGAHSTTAIVIVHCGRILFERYFGGWDLHSTGRIFSAGKSVTALLVGQAVEDGVVDIERPVTDYLGAGWSSASAEQEAAITVRHLLTMTSGLDESLAYVAAPGSLWFYNTPAYQVLAQVLSAATGQSRRDFSEARLESVIGMNDSYWRTSTMEASARDMARFGLLVAARGTWDGTSVLGDAAYFDAMLSTSTALNDAYGYLFWLNGGGHYVLPGDGTDMGDGPLIPSAPADLVAALGLGDKKIYIVPSMDLVVVRHGPSAGAERLASSSFDEGLWSRIMAAAPRP